ncbi:MAG: succinylglutamate desuccinylase/aspartoacylase family protein [Bdellovibrionales bacterium]|nr:succinylglutamate desuccinylase/aspartoacylase family protein [Bdellovibrionales bacterium]
MKHLVSPYLLAGHSIAPGSQKNFELPAFRLPTQTMISLPISVIHGQKPGPTLGLCAAIHGNEINGIESIRRITEKLDPKNLSGTVICVPVVNVYGFMSDSRYLPDGRDLNRSFPGSNRGSMASRLAFLFRTEVIERCDHVIDFHTASSGKKNHPQIRCDLTHQSSFNLAKVFAAPLIVHSKTISGSLRECAASTDCSMLVYESGEPSRFNQRSVQIAVEGCFRVMRRLKMVTKDPEAKKGKSVICEETRWIRASRSGIFLSHVDLGDRVKNHQIIGSINNIFGKPLSNIRSPYAGVLVGISTHPSVHQGDALIHIGKQNPSL